MAGSKIGPVHLVSGQNLKAWHGVRREGDPSGIGEDQLWTGDNVRLSGGLIVSRGGQSRLNSSPLTGGCILGIFDDEPWGGAGGPLMLGAGSAVVTGVYVVNQAGGAADDGVYYTTSSVLTALITGTAAPPGGNLKSLESFGGYVHYRGRNGTSGAGLRRWDGADALVASPPAGESATQTLSQLAGVGNVIWGSWDATSPSEDVRFYAWDGSVWSAVETVVGLNTGAASRYQLLSFTDLLHATGVNSLWRRSTAGVWTKVATPTIKPATGSRRTAVFNNVLYIIGWDVIPPTASIIYSWDGTTLVTARTLTATAAAGSFGLHVFNGFLYYLYSAADGMKLGRYDGTTWTDVHFTFASGAPAGGTAWGWLASYSGSLYAGYGLDANSHIDKSTGTDTTSWTSLANVALTSRTYSDGLGFS